MLKIENACIKFEKRVLFSELYVQVDSGEMVCISGESGGGKTSLLKAVMGFVPLQEGKISLNNIELSTETVNIIRRKVAWMPQELALPSEWVKEIIRIPLDLKVNKEVCFDKECLMSYFEMLGLDAELYNKRVNEISVGQRQRIMLATTAMLGRPLLMVDEPTSALDNVSCKRVLDFFHSLTAIGISILAVSHDRKFVEGCNRIVLI